MKNVKSKILHRCKQTKQGVIPSEKLIKQLINNHPFLLKTNKPVMLPPRQTEVLYLLAQGLNTSQCAEHLGIQADTVIKHEKRLKAALGAVNRANAIFIACSRGILKNISFY